MVGVAGRSRGCLTCRARKKGCDQQRPTCGQCKRSKLVCGGYQPCVTFVSYEPKRDVSSGAPTARSFTALERKNSPVSDLSQALSRSTFQLRVIDEYWQIFFPKVAFSQAESLPTELMGSWAFVVQQSYMEKSLVKTALLAVTLANLSRRSGDKSLGVGAIEAYSTALCEVNSSLQDQKRRRSDVLLATIKLLALYEASGGSGGSVSAPNWERHIEGVTRLLTVRGPSSHSEDLAHHLFLDARHQAAITAVKQRKPCILLEPKWMEEPFLKKPKDLRQQLLDIVLQVPIIQSIYDTAIALPESSKELDHLRFKFFSTCKTIDEAVQLWLQRVKAETDPDLLAATRHGIPEDFDLRHVQFAQTMALYWATSIPYLGTVQLAFQYFQVSIPSPGTSQDKFDPFPHAYCIARSVQYFFHADGGTISAQSFAYPMSMALQFLSFTNGEATEEYEMLVNGFSTPGTGEMVKDFLVSMQISAAADMENDSGGCDYSSIRARAMVWYGNSRRASPSPRVTPIRDGFLGEHLKV